MPRRPTIPAIRPNAGIEAEYRRRLARIIAEMHRSTLYWVTATWGAKPPEMAQDADPGDSAAWGSYEAAKAAHTIAREAPYWTAGMSPAKAMTETMARLGRQWEARFDAASPELARWFSQSVQTRSDAVLKASLKKGGFTVDWKMTKEANDVMQATVSQQVSLIKSIPQKYLNDVEGSVLRSVAAGRDLSAMVKEIGPKIDMASIGLGRRPGESDGSVAGRTFRRAAFIARDQNNKATSMMTKVRYQGLGVKEAIWYHSHGGRVPRPEHLAFSGKIFEIEKGAFLEGKWTWPAYEPNCGCFSKPILPGLAHLYKSGVLRI